jgi:FkbM family methyltransferase
MSRENTTLRSQWGAGAPLLIYGAGNNGRSVVSALRARGVQAKAFLDANAKPGDMIGDVPSYTPEQWLRTNVASQHDILISIHTYKFPLAPIIDTLNSHGFRHVLTMIDYVTLFPDDTTNRYWLCPPAAYESRQGTIAEVRELFKDRESLMWFDATIDLRTHGNYHGMPTPNPGDQYVPSQIPRWNNPMRLIDCGAYHGDSIEMFQKSDYEMEALVAFEPDLENYQQLVNRCSTLPGVLLPCGVASETALKSFDAGLGPASRAGDGGDTQIQCLKIDDALPKFNPTLIKMDIEGSEVDALRGAERTLRAMRPGLAISVYHTPDHLFTIPLWIRDLELNYEMFLRGHSHQGYDLVLYCHPRP